MNQKSFFAWFRTVAFAEGVSFIVLLLIAMPIKYIWHEDVLVKYIGQAHGILFVAYIIMAFMVKMMYDRDLKWILIALFMSFLPFGTFIMEKKWKKDEEEWKRSKNIKK